MVLALGVFTDVSVVVTLHFHEEHFAFIGVGTGDQVVVQQVDDVVAVFVQLQLDFLFVLSEEVEFVGRVLGLFLLLDGAEGPPGSPPAADGVLVCHR